MTPKSEEKKDEEIGTFWERLADLQAENPTIDKKGYNKHLDYHYALIDDVLRVYKPLLTKHGFVLYNNLDALEGVLTSILKDTKSDNMLSTTYLVKVEGQTDQKVGASLTYGRRYNASVLLNIATDEDIDGPQTPPPAKTQYKAQTKVNTPPPAKVTEKTFTKDEQQTNFGKHWEQITSSKDLKELQDNFSAFIKAGKVIGYVTQSHVDELIELKDAMKKGFEEKKEVIDEKVEEKEVIQTVVKK